jgi:hypothetical protein
MGYPNQDFGEVYDIKLKYEEDLNADAYIRAIA